ncbi:hypothetical protein ADUPG1_007101 [Aduncisulcus paluster]|uniref:EGF-like domain-containing protein n=1 Tax=Aduncisulcus paluster TaxID=2918883 RepID=A0ABQ5KNI7_9EUKA|nr:hypothetical protein ADUPG1_007101 [Aduncisulcus paluster]
MYCKCDAGWYGSTCFTQYPVETVEYVNDDDETNPTIVDYVCGVNYSTDPSSSYSDYGTYSPDTDTYSCDCSSYGLITDASTSTCIDPATHPYYKDIAGNDTACLTCGTTTDSHGTCVLGEGEDSFTAMCKCEYGWGNDSSTVSSSVSSCSVDMCGVSMDTYIESNVDPSSLCSSHGVCYSYDSNDSNNASNIQYACVCDDGWNGIMCGEEASNVFKILLWIFSILFLVSFCFCIFGCTLWLCLKFKPQENAKIASQDEPTGLSPFQRISSHNGIVATTVVQVRDDASLSFQHDSSKEFEPPVAARAETIVTIKRRVKKSKLKEKERKRRKRKKIKVERKEEIGSQEDLVDLEASSVKKASSKRKKKVHFKHQIQVDQH